MSADEWFEGKTSKPVLISLEKGFVPSVKKEFVTDAPAPVAAAPKQTMSEKDYQDAFHALRKENEALKNEVAQKDVKIRQLETQLESLTAANGNGGEKGQ